MINELNNALNSIDEQDLSEEEKEELKQASIDAFNEIPGVDFKELPNDASEEDKLNNSLDVTKDVLHNNINRIEKLTNILMKQVAYNPENALLISNVIQVISEQNKSIKLSLDLDNKHLVNKQILNKLNGSNDKDKKNTLPPGLSVE